MAEDKKNKAFKKFIKEYKVRLIGFFLLLFMATGIGIIIRPAGILGRGSRWLFIYLFGRFYLIFLALLLALSIYMTVKNEMPNMLDKKLVALYVLLLGLIIFAHVSYIDTKDFNVLYEKMKTLAATSALNSYKGMTSPVKGGGVIGGFLTISLGVLISKIATLVLSIFLIITGGAALMGVSLYELINKLKNKTSEVALSIKDNLTGKKEEERTFEDIKDGPIQSIKDLEKTIKLPVLKEGAIPVLPEEHHEAEESDVSFDSPKENLNYTLPPLSILKPGKKESTSNQDRIKKEAALLLGTLDEFGIQARVVDTHEGPSVTQYELEIARGIKLSKLVSLNKEIALNMGKEARIEAPIPGKKTVGIELANDIRKAVCLREILEKEGAKTKSNKLVAALGYDIMGDAIFSEINKTPHLLIAGSTGSGKSVCTNALICSLLMRAKPDEVKLLLIDPKKVELSNYNGVPHLITPVVVDPRKASVALQKAVSEMEKRFDEFADQKVKNIDSYNEKATRKGLPKMPYIVIIIDELADLMMVASKEVEASIQRITQMARAAGIHLIVATQRPSTDVITGVIKANIPSRISFAVASNIDSRTILDQSGAEKLLGKGDMLYLPMGESKARRIQGAFMQDEEIEKVIKWVCDQQKAIYSKTFDNLDDASTSAAPMLGGNTEADTDDMLYDEAYKFVIKKQKASISLLQRQFRIGYNRAARLIDLLEDRGVIGQETGSTKPREVLITPEAIENVLDDLGDEQGKYEDQ